MAARKPRERTVRRLEKRRLCALGEDRERLFRLEPGGAPGSPLDLETPALVESRAVALPCPRCGGQHELLEHLAVVQGVARLREARVRCRGCATRRSIWFRLPQLN